MNFAQSMNACRPYRKMEKKKKQKIQEKCNLVKHIAREIRK